MTGFDPGDPARRSRKARELFAAAAPLVFVAAAAAAGAAIGLGTAVPADQGAAPSAGAFAPMAPPVATLARDSLVGGSIAAKVDPGLVDIDSTLSYQSAEGAGTGMVLTPSGEILTNNHVIEGATKLTATDVGNGKTYPVTVVGYDPSHDIAVLQLQGASGLHTVTVGNSAKAAVGEAVVGIGNAGGAGGTPSGAAGSITGLNTSITASDDLTAASEQLSGLIQSNAGIRPGDSGGSLVNSAGQVLGMDTAASQAFVFSPSATQAYAIPINEALTIARQIETGHGSSAVHIGATAFLGVEVAGPSAGGFGGDGGDGGYGGFGSPGQGTSGSSTLSGVAVQGVISGDPAMKAGLGAGDTITSVNGHGVQSDSNLTALLLLHHPGDAIKIGWTDSSGQAHVVTLTLASGPPD